jgi:hypothetical protein
MSNENCAPRTLPKGYLRTGRGELDRADSDRAASSLGANPTPGPPYYLWANRGSGRNRQGRTGCIL